MIGFSENCFHESKLSEICAKAENCSTENESPSQICAASDYMYGLSDFYTFSSYCEMHKVNCKHLKLCIVDKKYRKSRSKNNSLIAKL